MIIIINENALCPNTKNKFWKLVFLQNCDCLNRLYIDFMKEQVDESSKFYNFMKSRAMLVTIEFENAVWFKC